MNWLQIDDIIYRMMARHDSINDVLKEAMITFKWNLSQAEAAVSPINSRHPTLLNSDAKPPTVKKKPTKAKAPKKPVKDKVETKAKAKAPKKPVKDKVETKAKAKAPPVKAKAKAPVKTVEAKPTKAKPKVKAPAKKPKPKSK